MLQFLKVILVILLYVIIILNADDKCVNLFVYGGVNQFFYQGFYERINNQYLFGSDNHYYKRRNDDNIKLFRFQNTWVFWNEYNTMFNVEHKCNFKDNINCTQVPTMINSQWELKETHQMVNLNISCFEFIVLRNYTEQVTSFFTTTVDPVDIIDKDTDNNNGSTNENDNDNDTDSNNDNNSGNILKDIYWDYCPKSTYVGFIFEDELDTKATIYFEEPTIKDVNNSNIIINVPDTKELKRGFHTLTYSVRFSGSNSAGICQIRVIIIGNVKRDTLSNCDDLQDNEVGLIENMWIDSLSYNAIDQEIYRFASDVNNRDVQTEYMLPRYINTNSKCYVNIKYGIQGNEIDLFSYAVKDSGSWFWRILIIIGLIIAFCLIFERIYHYFYQSRKYETVAYNENDLDKNNQLNEDSLDNSAELNMNIAPLKLENKNTSMHQLNQSIDNIVEEIKIKHAKQNQSHAVIDPSHTHNFSPSGSQSFGNDLNIKASKRSASMILNKSPLPPLPHNPYSRTRSFSKSNCETNITNINNNQISKRYSISMSNQNIGVNDLHQQNHSINPSSVNPSSYQTMIKKKTRSSSFSNIPSSMYLGNNIGTITSPNTPAYHNNNNNINNSNHNSNHSKYDTYMINSNNNTNNNSTPLHQRFASLPLQTFFNQQRQQSLNAHELVTQLNEFNKTKDNIVTKQNRIKNFVQQNIENEL